MNAIRIFKLSLFIRTFVIVLQVFLNQCVPDHNADAFRLPHKKEHGATNRLASFLFDGFTRWDAQYFLHVSLYGYTHENTLAFFPLFPMLLHQLSNLLSTIPLQLSCLNWTVISGVILNFLLASLASVALFKLTFAVFQSEVFAFTSSLLFCLNPASIFFSSLYSESLFCLLTFSGMWALEVGVTPLALTSLALSTSVRSNGVLAAGYFVYYSLKLHVSSAATIHRVTRQVKCALYLITILRIIGYLVVYSLPFVAYQVYSYLLYCTTILTETDLPDIVVNYVTKNDLKLPSEPSKWCFWTVPLSYSYIQSRYWNVGFLKYYTLRQIPNFLLATPILLLTFVSSLKYFIRIRKELLYLGLRNPAMHEGSDVYCNLKCFPYFVHVFTATIFCSLFIHIQVLTRMLCSSSPVIYWVASMALLPSSDRSQFKLFKDQSYKNWLQGSLWFLKKTFVKSTITGKFIFSYFLAYFFIGTFLHVNFFPWT